jgi:colicin import membrane protein
MNIATPAENQLVVIPADTALQVFTTDKAMDPFLARIRKELDAFVPDATTAKGRKAIASMAYTVAQSKTYLESVGKALADQQKEIPKKIDACRKHVRDTLDQWRDEVRKPLTDWEAAEDARVKKHTDAITVLNELSRLAPGRDSAGLRESIAQVDAVTIGPACEEFEADYARAKDAARAALTAELARAETREAEQAELARLRKESEDRAAADREAAIRKEAADQATRQAEAEAQRRIDAETAAANLAREEAEQAKKAAADTEARLLREAAERKAREDAELAAREADTKHRGKINRAAADAFVAGGLSKEVAELAVKLIARKAIPAITISY